MERKKQEKFEAFRKKDADLREWLIGFEQHLGRSCVVTLLIRDGNVSFISATDALKYLEDGEPDDPEPERQPNNHQEKCLQMSHNPLSG